MNRKVLIISSSPRKGGNSETLAAEDAPETFAGTEKAVQGWVDCFPAVLWLAQCLQAA